MLKRSVMLLMLTLLLPCGYLEAGTGPVSGTSASESQATPPAVAENNGSVSEQGGQSALELAMKAIDLSQGEGGIELWRLKAEMANMRKEDGRIVVQRPKLRYFMPESNATISVTSQSGIIDQKEQVLRFIDEVEVSRGDTSILGRLLVYNGTAKTMTFPQGGAFTGTGITGDAPVVIWDIQHKIIQAEGGVFVNIAASEAPLPLTNGSEK